MMKTIISAALVMFSTAYFQYVLGGGKEILTLYEHRDYKGKKCDIEVTTACKPVCDFMDNKASSMTWNGTCSVNLYKEPNCKEWAVGWNASMGGNSDFKGTNYQDIISSVGNCNQAKEVNTVYLYENSYYGGKRCEIKIDQQCKNVCDYMERKASSMDGTACVKLYKDKDCKNYGAQYDLMRGAVQNLKGTKVQDIIMSVSRC